MKNIDLLKDSYDFELDPKFIAERPIKGRHNSKLLIYHEKSGEIQHTNFKDLAQYLGPNNLLVLNQSKVFPCRLIGEKPTGGRVEIFLLSLIAKDGVYPSMIKTNTKKRIGDEFSFGDLTATLVGRVDKGDFFVTFNKSHEELITCLEEMARIPIPPYIRDGISDEKDLVDYQTVYAKDLGSVAAPTAGLHFTDEVFKSLEDKGVEKAFVTLHVGAGTFRPVTAPEIVNHRMHFEHYDIETPDLNRINSGKDIIAVGTTSLRVLESTYSNGKIELPKGDGPYTTDIFMYPGKDVKSISGLITNFHLPKSTLLMLVSAMIGREKALELYEIAKEEDYRFFSYGDAMMILR